MISTCCRENKRRARVKDARVADMLVDYRTFSCGKESSDREAATSVAEIDLGLSKKKGMQREKKQWEEERETSHLQLPCMRYTTGTLSTE